MKKLISLILTLCMTFSLCTMNVLAEENVYQKSWDLFEGLDILPFKAEQMNEEITRAEFASVIVSALGMNEEGISSAGENSIAPSFGNPNDATEFVDGDVEESSTEYLFLDVTDEHINFADIYAVTQYGIMNGNGDGYFRPDDVLKYEEAIKTFVVLCGYNDMALVEGGWFSGYQTVARRIEILLSKKSVGQTLTKAELIELFSKVLEAGVNDVYSSFGTLVYFDPDNGQSFMNQYMNIGVIEGQVTEVENTTLTSPVPAKKSIVVAGKTLHNDGGIKTNPYLGRYVNAYYDLDDLTLLYITYSKRDEVITIAAEDIEGFSNGVLSYTDGSVTRNYTVGTTPVIYNGTAKTSYPDTLFDFQFGDVTITDNGTNDVVIIRDFSDMIIGAIFEEDMEIYPEDSETALIIDDNEPYFIYDENGKEIEFSELTAGDAISYLDGESYKEIYLAPQSVSGTLTAVNSGEYEITVGGEVYTVAKNAMTANLGAYIGNQITLYVNIFGGVFKISASGLVDNIAVLISAGSETEEIFNGWVRLFMKNGNVELYPFAEKVKFYPQTQKEADRIAGIEVSTRLSGYTGIVNFKMNVDGEITELMLPLKDKNLKEEGDGRLWEKAVATTVSSNVYNTNSTSIGKQVFFDASSIIFSVPTSGRADDYKALSTKNFTGANYMRFNGIKAYYAELDDCIASATVMNDFGTIKYTPEAYLSVVTSIREEVNENDEIRKIVTVTNANNASTELFSDCDYVDASGNPCTAFDIATTDFATAARPIGVGDIIGYNSVTGNAKEVSRVVLIYDADMQNVTGGKKGYLAMATPGSDLYYIKNTSLNIITEWNAKSAGYLNSSQLLSGYGVVNSISTQNPIRFADGDAEILKTSTHRDYGGGKRFMLGYVSEKNDAFFHLTTQDLSIPGAVWDKDGIPATQKPSPHTGTNPADFTGIYYQEWQKLVSSNGCILNVDYYDKGIEIRKGTPADIHTYENSKNSASRVLSDTVYDRHIIINDYRTY